MPETMGRAARLSTTTAMDSWTPPAAERSTARGRWCAGRAHGAAPTAALYHNEGNGRFTDVTAGSGLDIPLCAMGCAVGDDDNDGRDDLFVTCGAGSGAVSSTTREGAGSAT